MFSKFVGSAEAVSLYVHRWPHLCFPCLSQFYFSYNTKLKWNLFINFLYMFVNALFPYSLVMSLWGVLTRRGAQCCWAQELQLLSLMLRSSLICKRLGHIIAYALNVAAGSVCLKIEWRVKNSAACVFLRIHLRQVINEVALVSVSNSSSLVCMLSNF